MIRAGVAAAVIKTIRDTNLTQPGVVPSKAFEIHGISVDFIPLQQAVGVAATASIGDDTKRLIDGGVLTFQIVDKPYENLPLPLVTKSRVSFSTTLNASTAVGGIGGAGVEDYYWLRVPLVLEPYQNFSAWMQHDGSPPLVQTFDMLLTLHGFTRRPAQ